MKKNIILKVAFCNINNKKHTIFSSNHESFDNYMIEINNNLKNEKDSIRVKEIKIQTVKDKEIYKSLEVLECFKNVITANNVYLESELYTWIAIKTESYEVKEDWDNFLKNNMLLNDWIEGNLKIKTGYAYNELSKEFGYKSDFKITETKLENHDDIWKFKDTYKGEVKRTEGIYAKYSYTKDIQLIEIQIGRKIIKLNQKWLEEKNPAVKQYKLYQ